LKLNEKKEINNSFVVDMWYGDKFEPKKYGADAQFYPHGNLNGKSYAGNIYAEDGSIIGDYLSNCSDVIEQNFLINFGD